jgi:hypothetical protein
VLGAYPSLSNSQLEWVIERSATDANPATGCPACPVGRDSLSGWGTLNVAAALDLAAGTKALPPPDTLEGNDDAGRASHPLGALPRTLVATLDYWDDPVDVYSIRLDKGERLFARLGLGSPVPNTMLLWRPGTTTVNGTASEIQGDRAARSIAVAGQQRLSYLVPATGVYYLEVTTNSRSRAADTYDLSVASRKSVG